MNHVDVSLINLDSLKKCRNIVPFIGAGLSVDFGYPTWQKFLQDVINRLSVEEPDEKKGLRELLRKGLFLDAAEAIDRRLEGNLKEQVRLSFSSHRCRDAYAESPLSLLSGLGCSAILTTNYDAVIETFCRINGSSPEIVLPHSEYEILNKLNSDSPLVVKLHGSLTHLDKIILTRSQYEQYYGEGKVLNNILKSFWNSKTLLFLGCSLEKDYLVEYIHQLAGESPNTYHYAILPLPRENHKKRQREQELLRLRIRPIWFQAGDYPAVYKIMEELCQPKTEPQAQFSVPASAKSPSIPHTVEWNEIADKISDFYVDPLAKRSWENGSTHRLFEVLTRIFEKSKHAYAPESLSDLASEVLGVKSGCALHISGNAGTGKSTLLSLLYYYFKDMGLADVRPLLIDLHTYDGDTLTNAAAMLKQHLAHLGRCMEAGGNVILFIDGINYYRRFENPLQELLIDFLIRYEDKESVRIVYSIGTALPPFQENESLDRIKSIRNIERSMNVHLRTLSTSSNPDKDKDEIRFVIIGLLDCFYRKDYDIPHAVVENLRKWVQHASGDFSEFRTVHFFVDQYRMNKSSSADFFAQNIGDIFVQYYKKKLGDDELFALSEKTVWFIIDEENADGGSRQYMIHKSTAVRDFLFAYYYVKSILLGKHHNLRLFTFILTPCVNRFAMNLIQKDKKKEQLIIQWIADNLHHFSTSQKTQMMYFVGRVKHAKETAMNLLLQEYDSAQKSVDSLNQANCSQEERNARLMYFRTIGISLIYNDCHNKEDDFYRRLIYHPELSRINRQFHIAYYSSNSYKLGDDPRLEDTSDSDKKVLPLYQFLCMNLRRTREMNRKRPGVFYLNIITLLSLVTYDHYESASPLQEKIYRKEEFKDFLHQLVHDNRITNPIIKSYVTASKDTMLKEDIYRDTLTELYNLKEVVRSGWRQEGRDLQRLIQPESVADHTWGACLLAQVFLTDSLRSNPFMESEDLSEYEEYDKQRIISILLFHDLAESFIGDYVHKREIDKENERNRFNYYSTLDSYPFFDSFGQIRDYWCEYDGCTTINAKIAFDIDKLEPLVQLFMYSDKLIRIHNEERFDDLVSEWSQSVNLKLTTQLGRKIYEFVLQHLFHSRRNMPGLATV